ncbi:MAG TPA: hypothetical protein DCZ10_19785, partial [Pelotomaculum sp.]|nr:hypothetical protein [Pelotomaculum sp.]
MGDHFPCAIQAASQWDRWSAQYPSAVGSYNLEHRFLLARLYLANDQLEETLSEAAQAKTLQLWLINTYEDIASIYVNVAVQQLLRGQ